MIKKLIHFLEWLEWYLQRPMISAYRGWDEHEQAVDRWNARRP